MPSRAWKVLPAIAIMALSFGVQGQTYNELSAMVAGPWHHVPNAVSPLQFNKDEAKCRVVSAQTPIDSTTPAPQDGGLDQFDCGDEFGLIPAAVGAYSENGPNGAAINPRRVRLIARRR
jgi:hypothetical protein